MKLKGIIAAGVAVAMTACSSGPSAPSGENTSGRGIGGVDIASLTPFRGPSLGEDGIVSDNAVTTDRVRLRRVGGGDIRTGLVSGQIIAVPVGVRLDVWAEIARLESDRARLIVNWGNGNSDFIGCGACRLENIYSQAGRYTLTVRIVDLNGASDAPPITSITVTIDAIDETRLSCADAKIDFEAAGLSVPPPYSASGVTVSGSIGSTSSLLAPAADGPELTGVIYLPGAPTTVLFDSDKNSFSMGIGNASPPSPMAYQAFDANGNLVASGSATATRPGAAADLLGTLAFNTSNPFRRVVVTSSLGFGLYGLDNIVGRCQ